MSESWYYLIINMYTSVYHNLINHNSQTNHEQRPFVVREVFVCESVVIN